MGKEDNFGDKINSEGFDKNPENINKQGSKSSIKRKLERLVSKDGFISFERDKCIIEDDFIKIKIPTSEAIAVKLLDWVMSSKGNDSIKAIQLVMDYIDGKATQTVDVKGVNNLVVGVTSFDAE